MSTEQSLSLVTPAPQTATTVSAVSALSEVRRPSRPSRPSLSAEELEALREVWSTPLIAQPVVPRPALLH
jgi:hypothetical protein